LLLSAELKREVAEQCAESIVAATTFIANAFARVAKFCCAGAHIITVPPQFLPKLLDQKYSRDTVRGFNQDAQKALARMAELCTKVNP
jgi:hypothetical protein